MSALRRAIARRCSQEEGFSLLEVVVAISLAVVLLTGGAHALGSSLKAAVLARGNTQSAELLSEAIETLRAADYAAIAMRPTGLTGDATITGTSPSWSFDPDGAGPLVGEPVVVSATGAVSPHVVQKVRNAQSYTVRTYVTAPTDASVAGAGYKRITVRASWTSGSTRHERQASTIVTNTRRGLPLPNFQVIATAGSTDAPIVVNAGGQLVLPFDVVNRGARDAFNLAVSGGVPSLTFTLHSDLSGPGTFDVGDTPAVDSNVDSRPDTGLLEVDASKSMLAVAPVPVSTLAGDYVFTITATSIGQPTAGGAVRTAQLKVRVQSDSSCTGCTYLPVYLRNEWPPCATAPCNTTARATMPLRTEPPTATSLANFDTDRDLGPGRSIARDATTPPSSTTSTALAATWQYPMASNTTLRGDVVIDLRVAVAGAGTVPGSSLPVGVRVYVSRSTSGSGSTTLLGESTGSYGEIGSTNFHPVRVRVPVDTIVAANRFLEIKVVVDSPTSQTGVWLGYDATTDPAVAYLPVA